MLLNPPKQWDLRRSSAEVPTEQQLWRWTTAESSKSFNDVLRGRNTPETHDYKSHKHPFKGWVTGFVAQSGHQREEPRGGSKQTNKQKCFTHWYKLMFNLMHNFVQLTFCGRCSTAASCSASLENRIRSSLAREICQRGIQCHICNKAILYFIFCNGKSCDDSLF